MAAALAADSAEGSPCCSCAAASAAEAAEGRSEPSMLKVDSSSWSRAATVRSSSEKDREGFIIATHVACDPAPLPG